MVRKTFTAPLKRLCEERLDAWRQLAAAGTIEREFTFAEAAEDWREARGRAGLRRRTHLADAWALSRILPILGSLKLRSITPVHVERVLDAGAADGLKASSLSRLRVVTDLVFDRAQRLGYVDRNPAKRVHGPKVERYRPDLPELGDVLAVLDDMRQREVPSWHVLWAVAATGARISEVRGLRWTDWDRKAATLHIAGQVDERGDYLPPKTESAMRTIPIGPRLLMALEAAEARRERATVGSVRIFARDDGGPWSRATAAAHWKEAQLIHWGRQRLRIHDLRHLAASQLIRAGVPLPEVARQLGHINAGQTMKLYAWAMDESSERVRQALTESGLG